MGKLISFVFYIMSLFIFVTFVIDYCICITHVNLSIIEMIKNINYISDMTIFPESNKWDKQKNQLNLFFEP